MLKLLAKLLTHIHWLLTTKAYQYYDMQKWQLLKVADGLLQRCAFTTACFKVTVGSYWCIKRMQSVPKHRLMCAQQNTWVHMCTTDYLGTTKHLIHVCTIFMCAPLSTWVHVCTTEHLGSRVHNRALGFMCAQPSTWVHVYTTEHLGSRVYNWALGFMCAKPST